MRILSIDFDYFVDASMETREECFPDGHDNIPPELIEFVWKERYKFHDNLKGIGLIPDYHKMCDFLKNLKGGKVLIADSHREIEKFFVDVKPKEELELVHIDFHHDMYITGGSKLDCGNWLRFLIDLKPDTKVTWVRREDSDMNSLCGEFPYYNTTDISEVHGEFDLIFLCFSSPWTPPHLLRYFTRMCYKLNKLDRF